MKIIHAIVLACALFASGCSTEPAVTSGKIIGKGYKPGSDSFMMMPIGDSFIMVPISDPDMWYIIIENDEGQRRTIPITRNEHDSVKLGDQWGEE